MVQSIGKIPGVEHLYANQARAPLGFRLGHNAHGPRRMDRYQKLKLAALTGPSASHIGVVQAPRPS